MPPHPIPIFQSEEQIPRFLGGLIHSSTEWFDDPRMGVRLRYGIPMTPASLLKADLYLYDLGQVIPADLMDPTVESFFQEACSLIMNDPGPFPYTDMEVRACEVLKLSDDDPGTWFHWAAFRYRQTGGDYDEFRFSHIALRTDGGFINKVRFTYRETMADVGGNIFTKLLTDWQQSLNAAPGSESG